MDFDQTAGRLFGVYVGVVVDVQDPDAQGRVKVKLPWVAEDDGGQATAWARLSTLMAGNDRGSWFVPHVDDEVTISFIAGDPRHPIVLGALWNGQDAPPEQMDADNNLRTIKTRAGHVLRFDDTSGAAKVEILTAGGHRLVLDDGSGGVITIEHVCGAKIEMDAAGSVNVNAPLKLAVTASLVTVDAPMSRFSGVVQADTVITNAVVSSSYTPGAGNVW